MRHFDVVVPPCSVVLLELAVILSSSGRELMISGSGICIDDYFILVIPFLLFFFLFSLGLFRSAKVGVFSRVLQKGMLIYLYF